MIGTPEVTARHRPSMAYYLSFAAALVGLVGLAIAIQGTRRALTGGDGLDALSGAGVPALIAAWAIAFYARLAFYEKLSHAGRALVHRSLRLLLTLEILVAIWASWYVLGSPAAPAELRGILIAADALQIGTALWIVRFSRQ